MKSVSQKDIQEKWYVIDAAGQRIGRIATIASELLLGKNDPMVRDYTDPRAHVIILNAGEIDVTEKRGFSKFYKWYSGFPGGLRFESLEDQVQKDPRYPLEHAIKGMLPKNKRGKKIFTNLRVIAGSKHDHEAQKPETIDITTYKL